MSLSAFRRLWSIVVGRVRELESKDEHGDRITKHYSGLVDFHVTPHLLRHSYITRLCASGMDIKKLQYLAGHSTVQMTLNVYSRVTKNRPEELAPDIISAFAVDT